MDEIYVSKGKGKQMVHPDLRKEKPDKVTLFRLLLRPTGNLRAPALRKGCTLLVYGTNGETLLPEHGFPLRIYIPNRYGMKQPKWITRIEAVDHPRPGY